MLHETLIAPIRKALRQSSRQPDRPIHLPQQDRPSITRDESTAEIGHHLSGTERLKLERDLLTVCSNWGMKVCFFFLFHTKGLSILHASVSSFVMIDPG
jgi:hypothetical protein